ncbi:MAG: helix-hairpin-helix domain-containing protein [Acidobacteriota bacterium]
MQTNSHTLRLHSVRSGLLAVALVLISMLASPAFGSDTASEVVNINTASAAELQLLPRVGPSLAGRILEFRDENGAFEAPEDLVLVQGIGEKTFQLLENHVVVKGETTLQRKLRTKDVQAANVGSAAAQGGEG